jgi:hypothetical protein
MADFHVYLIAARSAAPRDVITLSDSHESHDDTSTPAILCEIAHIEHRYSVPLSRQSSRSGSDASRRPLHIGGGKRKIAVVISLPVSTKKGLERLTGCSKRIDPARAVESRLSE